MRTLAGIFMRCLLHAYDLFMWYAHKRTIPEVI